MSTNWSFAESIDERIQREHEKSLIVYDYDGVGLDSAKVCAVETMIGEELRGLHPETFEGTVPEIAATLSELDDVMEMVTSYVKNFHEITSTERAKLFLGGRPHVTTAADYPLIFELVDAGEDPSLLSREVFASKISEQGADRRSRARTNFYVARKVMQNVDGDGWMGMHTFYRGFKAMVQFCYRPVLHSDIGAVKLEPKKLAVATSKDRDSTIHTLRQGDLMDYFDERLVVGGDNYANKSEQLNHISEVSGVPLSRMAFIDDQRKNCAEAKKAGVLYVAALKGGYDWPANLREGFVKGEYDLILPSRNRDSAEIFFNGFMAALLGGEF